MRPRVSVPRIAVCLQTCDRPDYTRRTLETFAQFNDRAAFMLLHGDDASEDQPALRALVGKYGFDTVVQTQTRQGIAAVRESLVRVAARKWADWVLLLENDVESMRPFPWPLFTFVAGQKQVYSLRLFGAFKDAARTERCKTTNQWDGNTPVAWRPLRDAPEKAQVGRIHWTAQPSITRTPELLSILRHGARPDALTVRVKKNVMSHIGVERTPGRVL